MSAGEILRPAVHHQRAEHGADRDDAADRKIDAAEDHHEGDADRGDADRRRLAQEVGEVVELEEGVRDQRRDGEHEQRARSRSRSGRRQRSPASRAWLAVAPASCAARRARPVGEDGADDDQALDEDLREGRDLEQVEQVVEDAEQQDRGEHADDADAAALERRAAEHHGDDRVELHAVAGIRIAGAEPPGDEEAGEPAPRPESMKASQPNPRTAMPARRAFSALVPSASRCQPKPSAVAGHRQPPRRSSDEEERDREAGDLAVGEPGDGGATWPMLRSVKVKITPCRMLSMPKVRISGWIFSRG